MVGQCYDRVKQYHDQGQQSNHVRCPYEFVVCGVSARKGSDQRCVHCFCGSGRGQGFQYVDCSVLCDDGLGDHERNV